MLIEFSTNKALTDVAAALEVAVKDNHFGLMQVHNLKETMKKKGIDLQGECMIFEVCQPDSVCHLEDLVPKIEQSPDNCLSLKQLKYCVGILEYLRLELTHETDVEHQANLVRRLGL